MLMEVPPVLKYAQWFGIELCYSSLTTSIFNTTVLTGRRYKFSCAQDVFQTMQL